MNWWVLGRKIHISWCIAILCFGIFVGVFLAQYINYPLFSTTLALVVSVLLIVVALWRKHLYLIPIIIFGGILIGLWRGSLSQNELSQLKPMYGKVISLSGTVKDDVDILS